ncbi:MAG: putative transposase [Oceanospirillaceae bacterium]|jgi:putative transposase
MVSFKGAHYPKSVIFYAVFFYAIYAVSYRELEEIVQEHGMNVGHATLNRWVVKYALIIIEAVKDERKETYPSWRMDETYIKVKGVWLYYYRGVGKHALL